MAGMKASAGDVPGRLCLDVCEMIESYPISLLAFAGYCRKKDMISILLNEGAGKLYIYSYIDEIWHCITSEILVGLVYTIIRFIGGCI